jgi:hypothetical protein
MQTLEAQVIDNTHLRLLQPIKMPRLTRVTIAVVSPESDEREAWLSASAGWLSQAYGDHEPEYSLDLIKQSNPEFAA